ncbi:TAXI family TRAP transporter solute-binding subunit [Salicibibacter kimchii]|uniref:TRAP transporter substrate-binding protein n=1 Tax=Salicibibacter kimchii TaxID=2099786 RepID=A0A345C1G5_9BACI|nr:TAXI family TRAP transporter solute-binding subunit [Salicibibacter kimchii]AXF57046.1 hypothetical protein DT065_14260 [Salicibibacter kimchii]
MLNRKKYLWLTLLCTVSGLTIMGCGNEAGSESDTEESPNGINIATHATGQAYNAAATGAAEVIDENTDLNITITPYSGPISWMEIFSNEPQFVNVGFLSVPDAIWAFQGENVYEETDNVRALVKGNYSDFAGYVVREDSDINSLDDLEGRTIATEYPGNNISREVLDAQLASVGLTFDDVDRFPVADVPTGIDQMREGNVEAVFVGDPEAAAVQELDAMHSLQALNFASVDPSEDVPGEAKDELDHYVPSAEVTSYTGGFVNEETTLVSYPNMLIGSSEYLTEEQAYELVKGIWENYEDLHSSHSWLEEWNPETMFDPDIGVPYHPGAVKYYKEIGVWNEEAEESQERLLNE